MSQRLKLEIDTRVPTIVQFYELRLLFLLTALRPELRKELQQVSDKLLLLKSQCQTVTIYSHDAISNPVKRALLYLNPHHFVPLWAQKEDWA